MKKIISSLLLLFSSVFYLNAQTTLVAGDIAFVGYNAINSSNNQSSFSFVILRANGISSGTIINFTDFGWSPVSDGFASSAEGVITWTATSALPQFTEVRVTATGQTTVSAAASSGTVTTSGFFILSTAGDQVLAYQGPFLTPTFVTGIHMNSETNGAGGQPASTAANWDAIAAANGTMGWTISQNRSAIPPSLTNGTNAIMGVLTPGVLDAEFDNGRISCANTRGASLAIIRTKLLDPANWDLKIDTGNPYSLPTGCTFGIAVLPVGFGTIDAAIKNNILMVNWSTYGERSNDHFEIQASTDGQIFKTIGTQKSLALEGNSDKTLNYDFSITLSQTNALLRIGAAYILAALLSFGQRKKIVLLISVLMAVLIIPVLSCTKNNDVPNTDKSRWYLRIMQVDADGTQSYSKVVKIANE